MVTVLSAAIIVLAPVMADCNGCFRLHWIPGHGERTDGCQTPRLGDKARHRLHRGLLFWFLSAVVPARSSAPGLTGDQKMPPQ